MTSLMQSVDERTRLAGANRLEVLLFSLGKDKKSGRQEIFGINVFKVREVMHVPEITRAPDMPETVEGMISLRGVTIPVINLPRYCDIETDEKPSIMIVTEYNKHVQGFLVHSVDSIQRLAREQIKAPPAMMTGHHGGLVTSVTEIVDKGLIMIIDVEKVLSETADFYDEDSFYNEIPTVTDREITVLFADDSCVARGQIRRTLEAMGVKFVGTVNGQDAWDKLNDIAALVESEGGRVSDRIQFILTDIEMPEMDGYVLTRKLKSDERFNDIPVIMHSSLSSDANQIVGKGAGADACLEKFVPQELAGTLLKMMTGTG